MYRQDFIADPSPSSRPAPVVPTPTPSVPITSSPPTAPSNSQNNDFSWLQSIVSDIRAWFQTATPRSYRTFQRPGSEATVQALLWNNSEEKYIGSISKTTGQNELIFVPFEDFLSYLSRKNNRHFQPVRMLAKLMENGQWGYALNSTFSNELARDGWVPVNNLLAQAPQPISNRPSAAVPGASTSAQATQQTATSSNASHNVPQTANPTIERPSQPSISQPVLVRTNDAVHTTSSNHPPQPTPVVREAAHPSSSSKQRAIPPNVTNNQAKSSSTHPSASQPLKFWLQSHNQSQSPLPSARPDTSRPLLNLAGNTAHTTASPLVQETKQSVVVPVTSNREVRQTHPPLSNASAHGPSRLSDSATDSRGLHAALYATVNKTNVQRPPFDAPPPLPPRTSLQNPPSTAGGIGMASTSTPSALHLRPGDPSRPSFEYQPSGQRPAVNALVLPMTSQTISPTPALASAPISRTPQNANKETLVQDILRGLGRLTDRQKLDNEAPFSKTVVQIQQKSASSSNFPSDSVKRIPLPPTNTAPRSSPAPPTTTGSELSTPDGPAKRPPGPITSESSSNHPNQSIGALSQHVFDPSLILSTTPTGLPVSASSAPTLTNHAVAPPTPTPIDTVLLPQWQQEPVSNDHTRLSSPPGSEGGRVVVPSIEEVVDVDPEDIIANARPLPDSALSSVPLASAVSSYSSPNGSLSLGQHHTSNMKQLETQPSREEPLPLPKAIPFDSPLITGIPLHSSNAASATTLTEPAIQRQASTPDGQRPTKRPKLDSSALEPTPPPKLDKGKGRAVPSAVSDNQGREVIVIDDEDAEPLFLHSPGSSDIFQAPSSTKKRPRMEMYVKVPTVDYALRDLQLRKDGESTTRSRNLRSAKSSRASSPEDDELASEDRRNMQDESWTCLRERKCEWCWSQPRDAVEKERDKRRKKWNEKKNKTAQMRHALEEDMLERGEIPPEANEDDESDFEEDERNECYAILNSAWSLGNHVIQEHVDEATSDTGWICQWDSCGQRFTNMDAFKAHISLHACVPFYCIYEGCDQSFNDIDDLCRHTRRGHRGARRRAQHTPGLGPSLSFGTQYQLPTGEIEWPLALVSRSSISKEDHDSYVRDILSETMSPIEKPFSSPRRPRMYATNRRPRELIDSCQFSFAQPSARTHGDGWNGKDEAKMAMRPLSNVDHSEIARLCRQGQVLFDDGDGMKDISSEDRDEEYEYIEEYAEGLEREEIPLFGRDSDDELEHVEEEVEEQPSGYYQRLAPSPSPDELAFSWPSRRTKEKKGTEDEAIDLEAVEDALLPVD